MCVPDNFILLNCQKFSVITYNPKVIFVKFVKQCFPPAVSTGDGIGLCEVCKQFRRIWETIKRTVTPIKMSISNGVNFFSNGVKVYSVITYMEQPS